MAQRYSDEARSFAGRAMSRPPTPTIHARIAAVHSDCEPRRPQATEATLRRQWDAIAAQIDRARAAVFSGASGLEPATSSELHVLKEIGLPVRNTGTYIGHGVDAHFVASLGIACAAIEHRKLFAPTGSGDIGESPSALSQAIVTGVGAWRGEGQTVIERVD